MKLHIGILFWIILWWIPGILSGQNSIKYLSEELKAFNQVLPTIIEGERECEEGVITIHLNSRIFCEWFSIDEIATSERMAKKLNCNKMSEISIDSSQILNISNCRIILVQDFDPLFIRSPEQQSLGGIMSISRIRFNHFFTAGYLLYCITYDDGSETGYLIKIKKGKHGWKIVEYLEEWTIEIEYKSTSF